MEGRDPKTGRFLPGNPGGPGNPHAAKLEKLRAALVRTVREADIRAILRQIIEKARNGDIVAAKLLLDRVLGPPVSADIIARLEELERKVAYGESTRTDAAN